MTFFLKASNSLLIGLFTGVDTNRNSQPLNHLNPLFDTTFMCSDMLTWLTWLKNTSINLWFIFVKYAFHPLYNITKLSLTNFYL